MTAHADRWGVPSSAGTVTRDGVLAAALETAADVVVFVAPSGFGKTIAAAQLALSYGGPALWISLGGQTLSPSDALRMIAQTLTGSHEATCMGQKGSQTAVAVREAMAVAGISDLWLFLDDLATGEHEHLADLLTAILRDTAPFVTRVVVTLRSLPLDQLSALPAALLLDERSLSLSMGEAAQFAAFYGPTVATEDWADLYGVYRGHPALIRMAVALSAPDGLAQGEHAAPDLAARALVQSLVTAHLSPEDRIALGLAALLKEGSVADLEAVGISNARLRLESVASHLPLVQLWFDEALHQRVFSVHDLVGACLVDSFAGDSACTPDLLLSAARLLADNGRWWRIAEVLRLLQDNSSLLDFLESSGNGMIESHQPALCLRLIDSAPLSDVMSRPKVLLLWARALFEIGRSSESLSKATAAIRVAEHELDYDTLGRSVSQRMQALLELGRAQEAIDAGDILSPASLSRMRGAVRCEILLSMGVALGVLERQCEAVEAFSEAEAAGLADPCTRPDLVSRLRRTKASMSPLWEGDFARGVREMAPLLAQHHEGFAAQQSLRGNLAWMLMETGRLERAESLVASYGRGNDRFDAAFLPVLAAVSAARGDMQNANEHLRRSHFAAVASDDEADLQVNRLYESCMRRAFGEHEDALDLAERSFEALSQHDFLGFSKLATVEVGASLLALDDPGGALLWIGRHLEMHGQNKYHALSRDAIRATAFFRQGDFDEAVSALRAHAAYIESESANWRMAMYCRTFPELLGLLAAAVGVDALPIHMLRMVLPENAEKCLTSSRSFMDPDEWGRLGRRALGAEQFEAFAQRRGRPICRVRLFGGLEVRAGDRLVRERDWKKRKARLLFAMLVARQGQDVARDQILDYLWPDLSEEKAKNNFYVAWSTMKAALMLPEEREGECPYVESRRGRCRTVRESVRSDIDEFEELLAVARSAEAEGDSRELVSALHQMMSVYRGDLLPGDVYDDWFAQLRDKYRFDFIDAMVRGAELLLEQDEPSEALVLARRALGVDRYREDLYQIALRCHIAAGQRSAAIETYIECKTQLAEQLGLDPAAGTMQLYQQILTMEDRPRYDAFGLS